jgi:pilus assembly protein Flp/PilA
MERIVYGAIALKNVLLSSLSSKLNHLKDSEDGVTAVEYALIIGLVAIVIIGAVTLLGGSISTVFSRAACVVKGGTWNTTTSVCS